MGLGEQRGKLFSPQAVSFGVERGYVCAALRSEWRLAEAMYSNVFSYLVT